MIYSVKNVRDLARQMAYGVFSPSIDNLIGQLNRTQLHAFGQWMVCVAEEMNRRKVGTLQTHRKQKSSLSRDEPHRLSSKPHNPIQTDVLGSGNEE
jgi:hypothetical protein